jgi:hypothetical protein
LAENRGAVKLKKKDFGKGVNTIKPREIIPKSNMAVKGAEGNHATML